jgi:hypothetical protein
MAKDYPLGKGSICKSIRAAIEKAISDEEKRPKKALVNRRACLLPRTVDGIPVKPSRGIRPNVVRLVF